MSKERTTPIVSEAEIRAAVKEHGKLSKAAASLGIPNKSMYTVCSLMGIKSERGPRASAFYAQLAAGKSLTQIAREWQVSRQNVAYTLKAAGFPCSEIQFLRAQVKALASANGTHEGTKETN